jgi:hypothetical protein
MKPLTVDNADGRTLLALRSGPMTAGELSARNGTGVARWLIKAGYITQDDRYFRITEAGRAVCPYRNPLAAPGLVPPATYKPEIDMSRENIVSRQQVLAAVREGGEAGISKLDLITKFEHLVNEAAVTSHLVMLKKDGAVTNPSRGTWVATDALKEPTRTVAVSVKGKQLHATREVVLKWLDGGSAATASTIADAIGCTEDSTEAVLRGLYAGLKVNRAHDADVDDYRYFIMAGEAESQHETAGKAPAVAKLPEGTKTGNILPGGELQVVALPENLSEFHIPPEAFETIEVKGIFDRTAPIAMAIDEEAEFECGVYSDGTFHLVIDDGLQDAVIEFSPGAFKKLRGFLGRIQEVA